VPLARLPGAGGDRGARPAGEEVCKVKAAQIFPSIIAVLMFEAGVFYIAARDWKNAIYWCAACIMNIAVTWL
jgi:hypothetical protein